MNIEKITPYTDLLTWFNKGTSLPVLPDGKYECTCVITPTPATSAKDQDHLKVDFTLSDRVITENVYPAFAERFINGVKEQVGKANDPVNPLAFMKQFETQKFSIWVHWGTNSKTGRPVRNVYTSEYVASKEETVSDEVDGAIV